ncbi:hypothetical protein [Nocardioides sp.]|uniref:hypothetical protein n=1 Tax=Nocardioides sp. TaxID=35761 RepID=UPI002ED47453
MTSGTVAVRLLTVLLLAGLGCVVAAGIAAPGRPGPAPLAVPPGPAPMAAAPDGTTPLDVLRDWDAARAAAWRRGNAARLRDLYVEGSTAGRADQALLAAYRSRGFRVVGMTMQRSDVRVLTASGDRMVVRVTDRLVGATAVARDRRVALPRDAWSTRVVVMVSAGERWRVADVRDQAS